MRAQTRASETPSRQAARTPATGAERCRQKFLRNFPGAFRDETYIDWERGYKVEAHEHWLELLPRDEFWGLIEAQRFEDAASRAAGVESRARHSMLFSFEKMALRDAVRTRPGAKAFAEGLYAFLHGEGELRTRFEAWVEAVASLPRRQTRVLTWPMVTVWGFIADPRTHFFVKPNVTRIAARRYGFELPYRPRPNWETYAAVLELAALVRRDQRDLGPRDMIDLQSFLWVQGSDEYA